MSTIGEPLCTCSVLVQFKTFSYLSALTSRARPSTICPIPRWRNVSPPSAKFSLQSTRKQEETSAPALPVERSETYTAANLLGRSSINIDRSGLRRCMAMTQQSHYTASHPRKLFLVTPLLNKTLTFVFQWFLVQQKINFWFMWHFREEMCLTERN